MSNWQEVEVAPFHQMKGCRWVRCIAHIRLNATGEVRKYETHEVLDDLESHPRVFNWEQNNYSCDCNRALFFARAINAEEPEVECSDGKYAVNLENPVTGEIYYREYDHAPSA